MHCNKCGAVLPEGSGFCPSCGAMVTMGAQQNIPKANYNEPNQQVINPQSFSSKSSMPMQQMQPAYGYANYGESGTTPKKRFSFLACFLWFFLLLKEKMIAPAVVSIVLVVIPFSYSAIFNDAFYAVYSVFEATDTSVENQSDSLSETIASSIHSAISEMPYGEFVDYFGDDMIDTISYYIADKLMNDLVGADYISGAAATAASNRLENYDSFGLICGCIGLGVFALICIFWGRRFSYYADLNRHGINFFSAFSDKQYRKL